MQACVDVYGKGKSVRGMVKPLIVTMVVTVLMLCGVGVVLVFNTKMLE